MNNANAICNSMKKCHSNCRVYLKISNAFLFSSFHALEFFAHTSHIHSHHFISGEFHKERVLPAFTNRDFFLLPAHRLMDACFECRTKASGTTHTYFNQRFNQCTHHHKWHDVLHLSIFGYALHMKHIIVCVQNWSNIFAFLRSLSETTNIKTKWVIETHTHA